MAEFIADPQTPSLLERLFPRLGTRDSYSVDSPDDVIYNCIGYAAGDTSNWWWPVGAAPSGHVHWPDHAPKEETLGAFEAAFALLGYEPCDDGEVEAGYEKIAFYANEEDVPTHATRQDPATGRWLSKLGEYVDISHQRVDSLEGFHYGTVCRFMKRRLHPE